MNHRTLALVLAGSVAGALGVASLAQAAPPAGKESCYGVAVKGHNDCAAGAHSCSGQSKSNYNAADFKYVPEGTCEKMSVHGHKGSLTPA